MVAEMAITGTGTAELTSRICFQEWHHIWASFLRKGLKRRELRRRDGDGILWLAAERAWPARMASASRASGDAVMVPDFRVMAQNSAVLTVASVVRTKCSKSTPRIPCLHISGIFAEVARGLGAHHLANLGGCQAGIARIAGSFQFDSCGNQTMMSPKSHGAPIGKSAASIPALRRRAQP